MNCIGWIVSVKFSPEFGLNEAQIKSTSSLQNGSKLNNCNKIWNTDLINMNTFYFKIFYIVNI
jgi:hypothetical protein